MARELNHILIPNKGKFKLWVLFFVFRCNILQSLSQKEKTHTEEAVIVGTELERPLGI